MKKFYFKLDALCKMRAKEEKQFQTYLAQVSKVYNEEEQYKNQCVDTIAENIRFSDNLNYENAEDVNIMMQISESNIALQSRIARHDDNLSKIKPELLRRQKLLAEASAKRRAVEILKEKKYKEYKKYLLKEEQKNLDEFTKHKDNVGMI